MSVEAKISPAFEPFLAESGPNDKRDAIVIYKAPALEGLPVRGRLRALKKRLDYIKERAAVQRPIEEKLFHSYQKASSGSLPSKQKLAASPIGSSALPVATVEVTRETLPALAEQPNVVAVLPNQRVHLIDPFGRRIIANPTFDSDRHGTHVCGTIAGGKTSEGVSVGVAPQANLLVAGVLIGRATLRTLMEGISWAVEKGADIINMSLGFSYFEPLFAEVFDILIDQYGILPVVAIGNENHGNSSSPGNTHNAFSVGAVEKMTRGKLDVAFFSSGASLVFPGAEPNALVTKPDVAAPGVQVFSCIPPEKRPEGVFEYTYMDGTSMATPHVAGVAALLMAARPEAPVSDITHLTQPSGQAATHAGRRTRRAMPAGIVWT